LLANQSALFQPYPAKSIRVLSTFGPGSVADGIIRLVAQKISASVGQPVLVEVQNGAGGVLGAQMRRAMEILAQGVKAARIQVE